MEPPHFYDSHTSKRSQIDHEILLLKQLQIADNTLLPVSTLPNEILCSIFLICRAGRTYNQTCMQNLLPLTWVCRHWRNVALSSPHLWAYIGEENLHWAAECLSRSKQAPLEGELAVQNPSTFDTFSAILAELHRFSQLRLRFQHHRSDGAVRFGYILTQPAPILELLELDCAIIPTPLFSGVSPLLHTVKLCLAKIAWTPDCLPFQALKHISLRLPINRLSTISFLKALPSSLPNLETLTLESALVPAQPQPSAHVSTRVRFPKLKELRLRGSPITPFIDFFGSCDIPSSTKMDVEVVADEGETVLQLIHLLQSSEKLNHCPIISVRLDHDDELGDDFYLEGFSGPEDGYPSRFELTHSCRWPDMGKIFSFLLPYNPTIFTLRIPKLIVDDWIFVFAPFENLRELELQGNLTTLSFMRFIIRSTPGDDGAVDTLDSSRLFPFKALQKLSFINCDLRYHAEASEEVLAFCYALKVRRGNGFSLREFEVSEDIPHLDLLKEGVDTVITY